MFSKNLFGTNVLYTYHSDQLYSGCSLAKELLMKQKLKPQGMKVKAQNTQGGNHNYEKKNHTKLHKKQKTYFCMAVSKFQKM